MVEPSTKDFYLKLNRIIADAQKYYKSIGDQEGLDSIRLVMRDMRAQRELVENASNTIEFLREQITELLKPPVDYKAIIKKRIDNGLCPHCGKDPKSPNGCGWCGGYVEKKKSNNY